MVTLSKMEERMLNLVLACQCFVVLFLVLHDWIPLGSLNNLVGIRAADSTARRLAVTVCSALPFVVGFLASVYYRSSGFPVWLSWWLWISYGAVAYGIVRAWWLPYLFLNDPVRTARYQVRFSGTHAFLPERNGIRPDTLHVVFHLVVVLLLICLAAI
jgi:hypothetical protein